MTGVDWTMLTVASIIVIWLAVSVVLAWRRIGFLKHAARTEWEAYRAVHDTTGLDEDLFRDAFLRAHSPRAPFWRAAGLIALILITPIVFLILDLVWPILTGAVRLEGFENGFGEGRFTRLIRFGPQLGAQAATYFSLIGAWVLATAVMVRAYHQRRPGRFEEELRLRRGGAAQRNVMTTGA